MAIAFRDDCTTFGRGNDRFRTAGAGGTASSTSWLFFFFFSLRIPSRNFSRGFGEEFVAGQPVQQTKIGLALVRTTANCAQAAGDDAFRHSRPGGERQRPSLGGAEL